MRSMKSICLLYQMRSNAKDVKSFTWFLYEIPHKVYVYIKYLWELVNNDSHYINACYKMWLDFAFVSVCLEGICMLKYYIFFPIQAEHFFNQLLEDVL